MTNEELEVTKVNPQKRWLQAITLQRISKHNHKSKYDQLDAKYALGLALGYVYAIDDLIALSEGASKSYKTVLKWTEEVEEREEEALAY